MPLHHTRLRFTNFALAAWFAAAAHAQVMAAIGGQVYNSANDDYINGATIVLTQANGDAQPQKFVTETRGLFLFENLPPGRYMLFAECPGFARTAIGSRGNPLSGATLSLVQGQQMNDLAFALTPGSTVAGKITDSLGLPVEGATVLALQPMFQRGVKEYVPLKSAVSDSSGDYKLQDLTAGDYLLAATDPTGASAATWYPEAANKSASQTVSVAAAASISGKDIRMLKASGHRVSGTLAGGGKAAIAWLTPKGGATSLILRAPTKIQADGGFVFENVAPGSYILNATESDGISGAAAPTSVTVAQKDIEDITLHAQSSGDLEGQATLGVNTPLPPGVEVVLENADAPLPRPARAVVDAKGNFTFHNLATGRYTLHVLAPAALYVHSARYRGADAIDEPFDFAPASGSPLLIMLSAAGAALGGSVRGADGSLMPGATVALVPTLRRFSRYKEVTADQFGEFHFEGIAPGEYRVYAWDHIEPGQYEDAAWMKKFEYKGQAFTAKAGTRETIPLKAM